MPVSIPQAVGTIAINKTTVRLVAVKGGFQYRKR